MFYQFTIQSQVTNQQEYLQRLDLGRKLSSASEQQLKATSGIAPDIAIILDNGLSSKAINEHALPLLKIIISALHEVSFSLAPLTLMERARVAINNEIGYLLEAKISSILIG